MVLGSNPLQPERIIYDRVGSQLRRITMSSEKSIYRFKGDFQTTQSEGCKRARIEPDINQLIVIQNNRAVRPRFPSDLNVPRRVRRSVPIRPHADGRAIHGPQGQGMPRVAGRFNLYRSKTSNDNVFEHLFSERAKRIVGIRIV